jgi:hypothetical protein
LKKLPRRQNRWVFWDRIVLKIILNLLKKIKTPSLPFGYDTPTSKNERKVLIYNIITSPFTMKRGTLTVVSRRGDGKMN